MQAYYDNGNYSTALQLFKQVFKVNEHTNEDSDDTVNASTSTKKKEIFQTDAMVASSMCKSTY